MLCRFVRAKGGPTMATDEQGAQNNAHPDLGVLAGGVAVVTGGASGIGFALVEKAIASGMHAVIADIEASAIDDAESRLADAASAAGVGVCGHRVDVSSEAEVLDLEAAVSARFPDSPVSLLCCNAGVGAGGPVSRASDIDWDFVLGVNVKGVANCVRAFVPKMAAGDAPGSVMATSSQDGLCAAQGVYGVSKHACVALTEALYQELRGRLTAHVLCPNAVATNIITSERNRPDRYGGPRGSGPNPIAERFKALGMPPSRCADFVFDAIRTGTFYIMAEAEEDPGYVYSEAETRMRAILGGGLPYRPRSEFLSKVFNPNVPLPTRD